MLDDLKSTLRRSAPTLAQDVIGGASVFVLLLVALHLPNLF
jgi:hypothetical protein